MHRRHLSEAQQATVVVEVSVLNAKELSARLSEAGKKGGRGNVKPAATKGGTLSRVKEPGLAEVAATLGVASPRQAKELRAVKNKAPEVYQLVQRNENVTTAQAKKMAKAEEGIQSRQPIVAVCFQKSA